ncbi:MAG: helix-turn-helix transcriptional regulator [Clostridia bacterium]|nr:helix-turn-helix transcriptional regulator [Clostridia bacterium]
MFYELEYHQRGKDALTHTHHAHSDCLEMIQVVEGEGQVLIRDTLYPILSGALYLIDGTETHGTTPVNHETYTRNKLIFSMDAFARIADSMNLTNEVEKLFFQRSGSCCPLGEKEAAEADRLFRSVNDRFGKKGDENEFLLWGDFFRLLSIASAAKPIDDASSELIDHILAYINHHISEKLSLDDIAKHVHIDKYYMCHYFKDKTNMTVMEYISDRRINMARRLLSNPNIPISDIAVKCGYSSASYFTQAFKSILKHTPAQYRNQLRHGNGSGSFSRFDGSGLPKDNKTK